MEVAPSPEEALAAIQRVESGAVAARLLPKDEWVGSCEPTYRTDDGWTIAVFDDCGDFDYIDSVAAPGEELVDLWPDFGDDYEAWDAWCAAWDPVRMFRTDNAAAWSWVDHTSPTGWLRDEAWPVVQEMSERHGISLDHARDVVLGYRPEPGTLWHAQENLRTSLGRIGHEIAKLVERAVGMLR